MATMSEETTMSDPEEDEYVAVRIEEGEDGQFYMVVKEDITQDLDAEWKPNVELQVGEDGLHTLVAVDESRNTTILAKQAEETREMQAFEKQNKLAEEPQANENPQAQPQKHPEIKQQPEERPIAKEQLHMKPLDPAHISLSPLPVADFQNEKPFTLSMANGSQEGTIILQEPVKTGKKNRVYGGCVCSQCGQTFVNVARLERHLSVHEVHGSFMCPLCGKTYKYEYNLFYHWRRNCRDMNELVPQEERRYMDLHQLRDLVDEVAKKKHEIGPIDMRFAGQELSFDAKRRKIMPKQHGMDATGGICPHCTIYVVKPYFERHLAAHQGLISADQEGPGGFFCDLCGLLFKMRANLFKHWRTSCQDLQSQLTHDAESLYNDDRIRSIVMKQLMKSGQKPSCSYREPAPQALSMPKFEDLSAEGLVYADDFMDDVEPSEELLAYQNSMPGFEVSSSKSSLFREAVEKDDTSQKLEAQCPVCYRTFADYSLLVRHISVIHTRSAHNCPLCGNSFKLDYNLILHYRRSCPHTKALIDRDVREQMDPESLRRLVGSLASRDIRIDPVMVPVPKLPSMKLDAPDMPEEPLKPLPIHVQQANLLSPRPGVVGGRKCSVCSVFFYGNLVLERHMKVVHPREFDDWAAKHCKGYQTAKNAVEARVQEAGASQDLQEAAQDSEEEEIESPPMLEAQQAVTLETYEAVQNQSYDHHGYSGYEAAFYEDQQPVCQVMQGMDPTFQYQMMPMDLYCQNVAPEGIYTHQEMPQAYQMADYTQQRQETYQQEPDASTYVHMEPDGLPEQQEPHEFEPFQVEPMQMHDAHGNLHDGEMLFFAPPDGSILVDEFGYPIQGSFQ